jgi:phosphate transport system permease protein
LKTFRKVIEANARKLKAGNDKIEKDDILAGLTAVLTVRLAEPQFEGQTKTRLGNSEVTPIVASVTREVLSQAPRGVCEAALALGGSRWGMIRSVILPFGRSGIVGAAMLGLGRALGETIAIALILAFNFKITTQILAPGGGSVAGLIANNFGEAGDAQRHALVAAGLALFVITLIVNTAARIIVNKTSKGKMED